MSAILWVGVALVAVIVMAGALDGLHLRSGQPFSLARGGMEKSGQASLRMDWLSDKTLATILSVLFVLGLFALPVGIVLSIVSPKFRKQLLMRLIPMLALSAWLLMAVLRREEPAQVVEEKPPFAAVVPSPAGTAVPGETLESDPPRSLLWATRLGLAVLLAGAAGAVVWFVWRRRTPARSTLEELAREAEDAISALQAGANVRDTVLRCYFEMVRVLREERGLVRAESMTPREFERRLAEAGLPGRNVEQLTRLFEVARYGAGGSGEAEAQDAISSLAAIVQACRSLA